MRPILATLAALLLVPGIARADGPVIELTTPVTKAPRSLTEQDVAAEVREHFGPYGSESRWNVTNPYLPRESWFLHAISTLACAKDGTIYLGADGVVPVATSGREPRSHKDWYADNGSGVWRVDPEGRVTAFAVRAYGNQPGWRKVTARCNAPVDEVALSPRRWGGMVVDAGGDVLVTDPEFHMVLRFRRDGFVEHVAGGGPDACRYDRYKTFQKGGYEDGDGKVALFKEPQGLAIDRDGSVLVADWGNCALRRIGPGGAVTTVHRGCDRDPADPKDRGPAVDYQFVIVDADGLPVVGGSRLAFDTYTNIHRFHRDGRVERLLAGRKLKPLRGQEQVYSLAGLALLPNGQIVIADRQDGVNDLIRVLRGGRLSRLTGQAATNMTKADRDGPVDKAVLFYPGWLCAAADGTLFVIPGHFRRPVRKIDPATRTVGTWVY